MIHYDNAHPEGINLGPTRVMPKSMGAAAGAAAKVKRQQIKRTDKLRAYRMNSV